MRETYKSAVPGPEPSKSYEAACNTQTSCAAPAKDLDEFTFQTVIDLRQRRHDLLSQQYRLSRQLVMIEELLAAFE